MSSLAPVSSTSTASTVPETAPFLMACRREKPAHTPVWFMRQAGRSLPEYRATREGVAMLDSCLRPDLVVEITSQPVRRYGVDAAILYSDIVLPLKVAGVDLDIVSGVGPVIASPIRSAADVTALPELDPTDVHPVVDAVHGLVDVLGETPLIGFAGAPFTLATYLIEGGPSKTHQRTKAFMYADPDAWHALMARLADISATFLAAQVGAGAGALQLFDSWVGVLSAADYAKFVAPHSRRILTDPALSSVPKIHFGVGSGELLTAMGEVGADVVGVDWRIPLTEAAARVGPGYALQGNLDPAVLFAPWPVVAAAVREVLAQAEANAAAGHLGHIFNLGHGVPPEADPAVLGRIVELVHESTS